MRHDEYFGLQRAIAQEQRLRTVQLRAGENDPEFVDATSRWLFRHYAEVVGTATVSRIPIKEKWQPVGLERFSDISWLKSTLSKTYTDAFLVKRHGQILAEWYAPGCSPEQPHLLMSVSKSLLSIVIAILVDEKKIDLSESVDHYVPELHESGFGSATIQQCLDMLVAVDYSEDYANEKSEVRQHDRISGLSGSNPGEPKDMFEFLSGLRRRNAPHGETFQYCSAVTDVLAWVAENATDMRYSTLLSDKLWAQLDCKYDARVSVDRVGFPSANGGVECTARDLARVGEMMLQHGELSGKRIVSQEWVEETFRGGSLEATEGSAKREVFPQFTYKNQWWHVGDERGSVHAVGIHGQYLWLDPKSDTVIVKFSSDPAALDYDSTRTTAKLFRDVIAELTEIPAA
jgi:CubicO group peptidase (beta-lactamase class C family)